jgi:hypothetical protein
VGCSYESERDGNLDSQETFHAVLRDSGAELLARSSHPRSMAVNDSGAVVHMAALPRR